MSQVLSGYFCLLDPRCDLLIKFVEAAPERAVGWRELRQYGSESRAENAAVGSSAEPRRSKAEVGNAIVEECVRRCRGGAGGVGDKWLREHPERLHEPQSL